VIITLLDIIFLFTDTPSVVKSFSYSTNCQYFTSGIFIFIPEECLSRFWVPVTLRLKRLILLSTLLKNNKFRWEWLDGFVSNDDGLKFFLLQENRLARKGVMHCLLPVEKRHLLLTALGKSMSSKSDFKKATCS
jgi:hypothetical protein